MIELENKIKKSIAVSSQQDVVSMPIAARLSPNSFTPTFTETSLHGKSWTHIMNVVNINGDKS